MSRHEFKKDLIADDGSTNHYQIVVGWDVGMQTYFALVYKLNLIPPGPEEIVVDIPNPMMPGNEIIDVNYLVTHMDGFGAYVPDSLKTVLVSDRANAAPRTPMQEAGARMAAALIEDNPDMFAGMFGLPDE